MSKGESDAVSGKLPGMWKMAAAEGRRHDVPTSNRWQVVDVVPWLKDGTVKVDAGGALRSVA